MLRWKHRLFEIVLILLVVIPHIVLITRPDNGLTKWFTSDDAYYYFKVAQNISEGRGITFDGISLTNGFHPLWMAVCIPIFSLARYDLYLPLRVMVVLLACLNAATGVLLFRLLRRVVSMG